MNRSSGPQAFCLTNSIFAAVFVLFFINSLNLSFMLALGFIPIFLIISVLKIYWMSAVSAGVLETASGEQLVFLFRRLHLNALKLWPGFLAAFIVVGAFNFLFYAFLPSLRSGIEAYFYLLETMAIYAVAEWAVNKEYLKPLNIERKGAGFILKLLPVLILLYAARLGISALPHVLHFGGFYWRNIASLMQCYVQIFTFIYCVLSIMGEYPQIKQQLNSRPKIFLINPMAAEVIHAIGFRLFIPWHPPFFTILRALTPKTYRFHEFNQVIWQERYYQTNALVCITSFTTNCYEAYKIAKEFKKRGARVVMGGPHVTYLPNEALAFCDSVIIGQAEGVWKEVIRDYEAGMLKDRYQGNANDEDYAQVHQELLNSPPSIIKDFLETSRGCKFRCHFCSVPALSGGKVRVQAINDIVDLIQKVKPHYSPIKFIDNNIYSDPGYARDLFTALKPLKIKWKSSCTIDIAKNAETLKLARESGCTGLFFGYEVGGASFEKNQGGKFGMAQKYLEYTRTVKKAGIKTAGAFIFGFDSDSLKSFFQTWKFCFSVMPVVAHISMLTPLPGSVLFQNILSQDRLINLNWRSHNYNRLVVRHPRMNPAVVNLVFPVLRILFPLTATVGGFIILLIILLPVQYWLGLTIIK